MGWNPRFFWRVHTFFGVHPKLHSPLWGPWPRVTKFKWIQKPRNEYQKLFTVSKISNFKYGQNLIPNWHNLASLAIP